ncbi:DNA mismatch repair endonuclease MutL [Tepidimicrobium xylanilyticum]|uniref:DNA mismatch repair protein MutL n=1 Tax=Tepidimicrobium xylanilyticum TaxID=1123352 RepID=A0A1H2Y6A5_9FIRM|nr:DNA mismatch repair endonuclease MutL [Tepidimicrobium xylanilyticum]GMG97062.1 DNA mismatch repair protein MutL [Tepidimicrobium xylanilyticum]SDX00743.1 DNA mismatch repair protein MutL [Tepidimicrobium xylanilyticum]
MSKIKILDRSTIQKIAAGEIIERPSSVVKELIENSLDANAASITLEIRNGGKDYIRITDDGHGFNEDDLKIAFKRHTTSKLNNIDDIYKIISFGFRGEALASISSVSRVEVLTKTENALHGIRGYVENEEILEMMPIGCPKGTTMIVKDLFYNIPVRKSFLKSNTIEANYISDIICRLALGNEGISFKYIKDNKVIFNISKDNDLLTNIYILLGREFADNMVAISFESSNISVRGYVSKNTFYRSNRNHQYLYVNNRYVKNYDITKLIEEKYKSIIPINKFPVYVVFIDINPSLIDVNIHPTKQEIKFLNFQQVANALDKAIDQTFNRILSIPEISIGKDKSKETDELPLLFEKAFVENNNLPVRGKKYEIEDSQDWFLKDFSDSIQDNTIKDHNDTELNINKINNQLNKIDKNPIFDSLKNSRIIGVLFSTFILLENAQLEKAFLIDQHAAHERILYEQYKREYESENVIIQPLLAPEIIELNNLDFEIVINNIELFNKLGFMVEEFSNNSVIIRGVPMLFGKPQIRSLFMDLADTITENIRSSYEVKSEKIMKIACTKAIKSGDNISDIEIQSLIDQLSKAKNPYTCPHGRPTIIEISKKDIEKEFSRIM